MKKFVLAGLVTGAIALGMVDMAQATSFTDENLWQSMAGSFSLEDFDNLGILGTPITSLPKLGVTLNNTAYIYDGSSGGPLASYPNSLTNIYPYMSLSNSFIEKLLTQKDAEESRSSPACHIPTEAQNEQIIPTFRVMSVGIL